MKPSFDELEAHICIMSCGSITAAAERLRTTKSVISKRLSSLEKKLGVTLFHRTGRSMKATEAGAEVCDRAMVILASMEKLVDDVASRSGRLQGTIRITAPSSFSHLYLNAIICDFMVLHPDIQVIVDLEDRFVDLKAGRYDFSVRIGRLKDSTLRSRKIAVSQRGMFCSPDYVSRHGVPERLEQLVNHSCLNYANAASSYIWNFESDDRQKTEALNLPAKVLSNSGEALKMAAIKGLGIAVLPCFMVRDERREGSLVEVNIAGWQIASDSIYVLYPDSVMLTRKARIMIDYIIERLKPPLPWENITR